MQVVIFDTETTDLIRSHALPLDQQPRVIELYAKKIQLPADAWGKMDEWQTVGEFESFINPGIKISEEVNRITGIDDSMVKGAPRMAGVWGDVRDFFEPADMVVAHNLSYDMGVMEFERQRIDPEGLFPWPKRKLCTVEATEHLKGYRLSLTSLHEHLFGCGFPEAHRARNDVNALELCFKKLWEMAEI